MKNQKILPFACFALLLIFTNAVSLVKASNPTEDSPLIEVVQLPDGTIERHYANGTVRHDYFVTLQFSPKFTFTTTTLQMRLLFWTPTDLPEDDFPMSANVTFLFLCGIGATGILLTIMSSLRRKPVKPRMPKLPFG